MFETDMYTHKAICEVLWQIYRRNEKGGKKRGRGWGGGGLSDQLMIEREVPAGCF